MENKVLLYLHFEKKMFQVASAANWSRKLLLGQQGQATCYAAGLQEVKMQPQLLILTNQQSGIIPCVL